MSDGGMTDEVPLSHALLIDDPEWPKVWEKLRGMAPEVTEIVQSWLPKATKRVWRIGGTGPGGVPLHPSIHTNDEIAKDEIAERLLSILESTTELLFKLDAQGRRKGWGSSTSTALMNARLTLQNGKILRALRMYHSMLSDLGPEMKDLINRHSGTLDVEAQGLFIEEVLDQ